MDFELVQASIYAINCLATDWHMTIIFSKAVQSIFIVFGNSPTQALCSQKDRAILWCEKFAFDFHPNVP